MKWRVGCQWTPRAAISKRKLPKFATGSTAFCALAGKKGPANAGTVASSLVFRGQELDED